MRRCGLVLFFTDSLYRTSTLMYWKFKFMCLPGIRRFAALYAAYKMEEKLAQMDPWERHCAMKEAEHLQMRTILAVELVMLHAAITSEEMENREQFFEEAKNTILQIELINNDPKLQEFKSWLQNATINERNPQPVRDTLKYFGIIAEQNPEVTV